MKLIFKKLLCLISAFLSTLFVMGYSSPVRADIQIEISGNGSGTSNSVTVQNDQTTTVTQTNDASVNNQVDQSATTGNNTANANTGDTTQITTGDSTTNTSVSNSVNNSQIVVDPCCDDKNTIEVKANGESSQNTVNAQVASTTTISVNQTAVINNTLSQIANTGDNNATNNNGNVHIGTGDIFALSNLTNSANLTDIKTSIGNGDLFLLLSKNGADSVNTINVYSVNTVDIFKNDFAVINNTLYADLNTGRNTADGNLGSATIVTGDIYSMISVVNDPINTEKIEVTCCVGGGVVPPGGGGETPPAPPPTSGGGGGNGGAAVSEAAAVGGQVLGAISSILPITGASALHFWILAVVYLLLFLAGLYLRLRAGRSPSRRFAGYYLLAY